MDTPNVKSNKRFLITSRGIVLVLVSSAVGISAMLAALFYQAYYLGASLFAVFTLLFAFSVLFVGSGLVAYSTFLIPFGSAFFFFPKDARILLVFLVAGAFGVMACWLTRREVKENLSSHTYRPLKVGLPMFFTAAAILASLFYYVGIKENQQSALIPKKAFNLVLPYVSGSLVQLFPQKAVFDLNKSVDTLLGELIKSQASSGVPQVEMPRYIKEERIKLSNQLGIDLQGDERTSDVFYNLVNKKVLEFTGPYLRFMGLVLATGLFFGLKAVSIALYWATIALMPVLVWAAKKAALLHEEVITVEVSRLFL